jgi:transcription initiation factor TFIIF subunit alpha
MRMRVMRKKTHTQVRSVIICEHRVRFFTTFQQVEEEEEEEIAITSEPAIQQQPQQVKSRSSSQAPQSSAQAPQSQVTPSRAGQTNPVAESRGTSPTASPSLGGHSVVAKRATSPKAPKTKTSNMSRGNSPLGSRATSPTGNARAGSPGKPESPTVISSQKSGSKRKADELTPTSPITNAIAQPKPKKRKAQALGAAPIAVSAEELRSLLIEWLGNTGNATTRDCIHHFTPYLTDVEKKTAFSALVREVAQLKNGGLVLRKKYQEGGSTAPSPAPNSAA